jgi:hypothetical protein
MILATVAAQNATCIYSHDKGLGKLADGILDVREIPELVAQMDLFEGLSE